MTKPEPKNDSQEHENGQHQFAEATCARECTVGYYVDQWVHDIFHCRSMLLAIFDPQLYPDAAERLDAWSKEDWECRRFLPYLRIFETDWLFDSLVTKRAVLAGNGETIPYMSFTEHVEKIPGAISDYEALAGFTQAAEEYIHYLDCIRSLLGAVARLAALESNAQLADPACLAYDEADDLLDWIYLPLLSLQDTLRETRHQLMTNGQKLGPMLEKAEQHQKISDELTEQLLMKHEETENLWKYIRKLRKENLNKRLRVQKLGPLLEKAEQHQNISDELTEQLLTKDEETGSLHRCIRELRKEKLNKRLRARSNNPQEA